MPFKKAISKFTSVQLTLIIFGLGGITLLLILFGYLIFTSEKQGLTQQAEDYLANYATVEQQHIIQSVDRNQAQIKTLAHSSYLFSPFQDGINAQDRQSLRQYLADHLTNQENFLELLLINPNGKVIVSTESSQDNTNKSNRTYFQEARTGITIQKIYHHLSWQKPVITIAAPLNDEDGQLLGILAGHLNVEQWDRSLGNAQGLGESGAIYLVNDYNYFVTSPGGKPGYAFLQANYSQGVQTCLTGKSNTGRYEDYRGEPVLGAYLWMENLNMCLVTEMEESEALAPIKQLTRNIAYTLIIALALGSGATIFIANAITKPIKTLTHSATRLRDGDLSHRTHIQAENEIGFLASSFNQMADRLMKTILKLRRSEENLRNFFDTTVDFLWVLDKKGEIITINETVTRRLGYQEKELVGKSILMAHPPKRREKADEVVMAMLRGERDSCPVPLMTKDGSQIPVETYITRGEWNGKTALFGVSKDVSALKLSEEKFAKAFNTSPSIMGLSDLDTGEYVEVNQSFYNTLGFKHGEVIGEKSTNLLKLDPKFRKRMLQKLKQQGSVRNEEGIIYAKNGTPVDVLFSAEIIDIQDKHYNFSTALDITERKETQKALQESEERLKLAVEGTGAGLWDWQVPTGELVINERWAGILGYSLEELQPISIQTWINFTHPDDLKRSNRLLEKHFHGENDNYLCEARMRHKDGHWVWVLDRGKVVQWDENGKPLRMTGTHVDITDQVEARFALKESEARYRSLFEAVADGIIVTDCQHNIQYANPAIESITGFAPQEIIQANDWKTFGLTEKETEAVEKDLDTCINQEKTWRQEAVLLHPEGGEYDADIVVSPMRDKDKSVTGLIISIRDITKMKKLERMKSRFVSSVSHELRTPLSIIILYVENLIEFYAQLDDTQRQDMLNDIQDETASLQKLIENVLLLSRLDAGSTRMNISTFAFDQFIQNLVDKTSTLAKEKGVQVDINLPDTKMNIFADRDQLRRVFRNILENAIKFTPKSGKVSLAAYQKNEMYEVTIKDTGIGIPPEEIPNIFKRFRRGKYAERQEVPGTGLGLSIAKEIVNSHNGRIDVESEVGKGTTFKVILPTHTEA